MAKMLRVLEKIGDEIIEKESGKKISIITIAFPGIVSFLSYLDGTKFDKYEKEYIEKIIEAERYRMTSEDLLKLDGYNGVLIRHNLRGFLYILIRYRYKKTAD